VLEEDAEQMPSTTEGGGGGYMGVGLAEEGGVTMTWGRELCEGAAYPGTDAGAEAEGKF
jgi:hypothetical protein